MYLPSDLATVLALMHDAFVERVKLWTKINPETAARLQSQAWLLTDLAAIADGHGDYVYVGA